MVSGSRTNRLVLIVCWMVFYCSFTLFAPPLLDDADSVHAEVAREMIVRHDWVTLYANGIRYLEKAPLYYWSMAASYKVFGLSTAASRVPLALGVLLLALLIESFGRRGLGSSRAGLYAGLITLSSFGIFIFSRINIPDVLVCCWLTLALYAFWLTEQEALPSARACWLFALACALNVLTKGLIGIVFPVGIVLVYLLATRGWAGGAARLRQLHLLSSALVFLAIAVPWHVLAALANPTQGHPGGLSYVGGHFTVPLPTEGNVHGWAWFYFVNEQVLRYMNLRVPRDYDTVPLWLFLGLIFIWLMPWSAFLPEALAEALPLRNAAFRKRLRGLALDAGERTNLLLMLWAVLPLAFFSLSTAAGVLRAAGAASDDPAGGSGARCEGRRETGFIRGAAWFRSCRGGCLRLLPAAHAGSCTRHRPGLAAAAEPGRLRAFVRALHGPECAGTRAVSWAVDVDRDCAAGRDAGALPAAAARTL